MSNDKKEIGMMNLEKLIETREYVPSKPFPIPTKELLERYEKLYTPAINDVLREMCLLEQALPGRIMPLRDEMKVAGIAFTVKSAPNTIIRGEMAFRTQMLAEMHEDAMVVWDTSRDQAASLWGGVMTATAKSKKVRGAIIDGGIRDTGQILDQKFPIWYEYRTSNGSLGRCLITHYQRPVKIGDVTVRPGDVIFADIDGAICIPRDLAMQVLLRAESIRDNEDKLFDWIAHGQTIEEIVAKGGYF